MKSTEIKVEWCGITPKQRHGSRPLNSVAFIARGLALIMLCAQRLMADVQPSAFSENKSAARHTLERAATATYFRLKAGG